MDEIDEILSRIDDSEDEEYKKLIDKKFKDVTDASSVPDEKHTGEAIRDTDGLREQSPYAEKEPRAISEDGRGSDASPLQEGRSAIHGEITGIPRFTIRGTRSWNTKEPYIIQINPDNLKKDKDDIANSFYFINEQLSDDIIKDKIKEKLLFHIRKPDQNIIQEYEQFIYKAIINEAEKAVEYFQIEWDAKNQFIYHIGPHVFFKIVTTLFQRYKIGFCYKVIAMNKSVRLFPEEYIKEKILIWMEENINVLDLQFDNVHQFNSIKNIVAKKYLLDVKKFTQKVEAISAKLGPDKKISKEKLIAMKGDEWFGISAIEVYKRFIDRTIFHRLA